MSQANQRFRDDRNFHKDSYYHNRERTHYNKHEGNYQKERKNSYHNRDHNREYNRDHNREYNKDPKASFNHQIQRPNVEGRKYSRNNKKNYYSPERRDRRSYSRENVKKKSHTGYRNKSGSISKSRSRSRSYSLSKSESDPRSISSSSSSSYKAIKKSEKKIVKKGVIEKNIINPSKVIIDKEDEFDMTIRPSNPAIHTNKQENYNYNNSYNPQNAQSKKQEKEMSNTLMITQLGPDINLNILEDVFREKCLDCQTSMPEDIKFMESIRLAYIIFPSTAAASKVYDSLNGLIYINGNYYQVDYTPNVMNYNINSSNKAPLTYVQSVSDLNAFTTALETTVHEDWICEFCDCKNFSKRNACFRCKKPKTMNCRVIPVIKQKTTVVGENGQIPPSSSLMIRANVLKEVNETELLEAFSQYGQVKDIRMIADKVTGEPKEYAFVEYFSIDEATVALNQFKRNPLKMRGNPIYATFSKIRKAEDYKELLENSRTAFSDHFLPGQTPSQTNQAAMTSSSNLLDCINISNLSAEEQNKLRNISNLQNMIQISQNTVSTFNVSDTRGETNLRKEKDLTEREKIELEMKKWKKEQTKIDKQKADIGQASLKSAVLNYDLQQLPNLAEYEFVISLDQRVKDATTPKQEGEKTQEKENDNKQSRQENSNEGVICTICQRKFPNEEKLRLHENLSPLHKENLKKLGLFN